MAEKEIVAQIDKLRKTRPARAVETLAAQSERRIDQARNNLVGVLEMLRDDLKDEARLVEQAKLRGSTSIMKDRLAVAGWMELFVVQLGRESDEPSAERLSPSHELTEHRPSERGTDAASLSGPGGRCAVGNVHTASTVKCPCGLDLTASGGPHYLSDETIDANEEYAARQPLTTRVGTGEIEAFLSGASDTLPTRGEHRCPKCDLEVRHNTSNVACPHCAAADAADVDATPYCFGCDMDSHRCPGCGDAIGHDEMACKACRVLAGDADGVDLVNRNTAAYIGDTLIDQIVGTNTGQKPTGIIPAAAQAFDELTTRGRAMIEQAAAKLGVDLNEQAAHDTIDRELAHVTADPIVDPFAPIPRAVWAPAVPPNGRAWTTADLLAPVDAASLPPHLSFSQATTAVECGAKYRMQRIANAPQVPQWANIGGKAFHAAVEDYEHGGRDEWGTYLDREIAKTEQASGMTREQFRASAQGRENYDWWRVEGAAMLQRYVDWRQGAGAGQQLLSGPSGAPMLEWETTYDVDGVPFKTILDSVWTTAGPPYAPEVSAVIRDWKTGSMTPDNRQLCTQAWGLRMAGWSNPILVQFFDARKGTFSEPFDPFDAEHGGMSWDDVRYFVLSADAQRRLPILPARPSDFCGGCSVAYACPIMSQRKAPKAATK